LRSRPARSARTQDRASASATPGGVRLEVDAADYDIRVCRVEDSPCEVDASLMVIAMLLQVGQILGKGVSAFGPSGRPKTGSPVYVIDRRGPRLKVRRVVFGAERLESKQWMIWGVWHVEVSGNQGSPGHRVIPPQKSIRHRQSHFRRSGRPGHRPYGPGPSVMCRI
jgi:hypothetical protein